MSHRARLLLAIGLALAMTKPVRGKERIDRYGDPLPPGAVARLGTLRWRHGQYIMMLAFSPDGKRLASGDHAGKISVWDSASGKELQRFALANCYITSMAFSPNGKLLAVTGVPAATLYVFDVFTGKEVRRFEKPGEAVGAVAFSPDGKLLAGGGWQKVYLWKVGSDEEPRELNGLKGAVVFLTFLLDSKSLLVGLPTEILHLDLATGKRRRRFSVALEVAGLGATCRAALSPDGALLASLAAEEKLGDETVRLWRLDSGKEVGRVPSFGGNVSGLAFSPNGKMVVAVGDDGEWNGIVKVWDVATKRQIHHFKQPGELRFYLMTVAFSPDSKRIAVGGNDNCVRFFDAATGKEMASNVGHQGKVASIACLDGNRVATAGNDNTIRIWDAATGKELRRLEDPQGPGRKVFSPDGKRLLSADGSIARWWDSTSGKEIRRVRGPGEWVNAFARSSSGGVLAVNVGQTRVEVWDANTGEVRRQLDAKRVGTEQIVLSPDGRTFVSRGPDREVWSVVARTVRYQLEGDGCVAFSPDGRTLAFRHYPHDERLRNEAGVWLWEVVTGRERCRLRGTHKDVHCLVFSPDGLRLALAEDGVVSLWDAVTGEALHSFEGHRGYVNVLAFSTDGRRLISGSADTTALVWDVERWMPKGRSAKDLTDSEWKNLWSDLASDDARRAYRAIHVLRSAEPAAVRWLRQRLKPAETPKDRERVAELIGDLDSDTFAVRESASRQLEKLGSWAEPCLRAKLKERPSLEVRRRMEGLLHKLADEEMHGPQPEVLRTWRAVEVLEHSGTAEARALLESLARGAAEARLTQEAKESLARQHIPFKEDGHHRPPK